MPVSVTLFDVGVTTKAHIWRLQDSVEVGYGVGLMHATSGTRGTLGGKTMNKFTFTVPRVMVKPLVAIVDLARSRYAVSGLGVVALSSALGALEISKRPRRRGAGDPDDAQDPDVGDPAGTDKD